MTGIKVYFNDDTEYFMDNESNYYSIDVAYDIGVNNKTISCYIDYTVEPSILIFQQILNEYLDNKNIKKVEWYNNNIIYYTIEGNIQIGYYLRTVNNGIREEINFNRVGV